MSRLLFIIVIVAVVFWWFKSVRKQQRPQDRQEEQPPRAEAEDMVRCVECGVHLPKNESYFVGGKYYCSEAHSRSHSGKAE